MLAAVEPSVCPQNISSQLQFFWDLSTPQEEATTCIWNTLKHTLHSKDPNLYVYKSYGHLAYLKMLSAAYLHH